MNAIARLSALSELIRLRKAIPADDARFVVEMLPESGVAGVGSSRQGLVYPHPAGVKIKGAPAHTFIKSAIVLCGRRILGRKARRHAFFAGVENDLALHIMRSSFVHGDPKGCYCCPTCTLAVLPLYSRRLIEVLPCAELGMNVREVIQRRQWRFRRPPDARVLEWALSF